MSGNIEMYLILKDTHNLGALWKKVALINWSLGLSNREISVNGNVRNPGQKINSINFAASSQ